MKIVVGASSFGDTNSKIESIFLEHGIKLIKNPYGRRLTEEEIIEHLQGADGLLAGLEPLNENVFRKCPNLKAIARIGIGMDNIDMNAAQKYAIKVSNTPEAPTNAVAEMTLAALLSICHNIIPSNNDVHKGIWNKRIGDSITDKTVFIIGYGHIGQKVTQTLKKLGVTCLIYDKYNLNKSTCTFEDGLKKADVISLHASGQDEIITEERFHQMKDGVIILNSARGKLIHEKSLYHSLKNGKVAAFWGDALWTEPYDGLLKECDNAILTPHICTYTHTCRSEMEMQATKNILEDLGYEI